MEAKGVGSALAGRNPKEQEEQEEQEELGRRRARGIWGRAEKRRGRREQKWSTAATGGLAARSEQKLSDKDTGPSATLKASRVGRRRDELRRGGTRREKVGRGGSRRDEARRSSLERVHAFIRSNNEASSICSGIFNCNCPLEVREQDALSGFEDWLVAVSTGLQDPKRWEKVRFRDRATKSVGSLADILIMYGGPHTNKGPLDKCTGC